MAVAVPKAGVAVIGGTGSRAASFPADSQRAVHVLEEAVVVDTPYGESPPFTLFELDGRRVLHVPLHGWRRGVPRGVASRQVFSVLQRAGVRRILGDAGVGSLNHLLDPGDLVVPDDFVDMTSQRAGEGVAGDHLLIMRDPVCPEGPRFESPAEVRFLRTLGDIVGQSFSPEVWLARDIGACYAGIYVVVNYAEGVVEDWSHDELGRIFHDDAPLIGEILLAALTALPDEPGCSCRALRKPTLLS
jgi:5'-methylthioadenosine phosphorylase